MSNEIARKGWIWFSLGSFPDDQAGVHLFHIDADLWNETGKALLDLVRPKAIDPAYPAQSIVVLLAPKTGETAAVDIKDSGQVELRRSPPISERSFEHGAQNAAQFLAIG